MGVWYIKLPMTKSYLTHLSSIFFLHALVLMGTWKLSQSEFVRTQIGQEVLTLKIASDVMLSRPEVKKPTPKVIPLNPNLPKTQPLQEEAKVSPPEEKVSEAKGSEFGTNSKGKTDLMSVYKAELRAMIDKNKYYPPLSRRLGQTGTVVVAFTLLEDGNIIDVRIDKPSRYDRLNVSALDAVKKVERFKPIPKEAGEARMDIKVPVKFFTI